MVPRLLLLDAVAVQVLLFNAVGWMVASHEYTHCQDRGISVEISGVVDELELSNYQRVVVAESSSAVRVECRADTPIKLLAGFETDSKARSGSLKSERILWKEKETNFWSSKNVSCFTETAVCSFNITLANRPDNATNCTLSDEKILCNIRDWFEEVQKDRSSSQCARSTNKPKYQFSFYNNQSQSWNDCNYTDQGPEKLYYNVSQIVCDVVDQQLQEADKLIIKLSKRFMSTNLLNREKRIACEESTYLAVSGDLFELKVEGGVGYATTGAIIVVLTVFVLLAVACCIRQIQLRRNQPLIIYSKSSSRSYQRTSGPNLDPADQEEILKKPDPEDPEEGQKAVAIDPGVAEKDQYDLLLDGALSELNPTLPVNRQTKVLQYDRSFEISRDAFKLDYILGEGQYGTVYKATILHPSSIPALKINSKVAVKLVKNMMDDTQWRTILDELKILSYLEVHFNLVNLVAANTASIARHELFLLLELCPYGDMKSFLVSHKDEFLASLNNKPGHLESEFSWTLLQTWAYSISCGMDYLASKKIMHGDLAARNILVGENYSAKISDFGLSKMMYYNEDYKKTERRMIPWAWMAVEYLQTGEFNLMSDVWSFGVTLWEIFSLGHKPYGLQSYEYMKVRILEGERLESPRPLELHPDGYRFYAQVMLACWREAPNSRPSFSELRQILQGFLGQEGVQAYKEEEQRYLNFKLNPDLAPKLKPTRVPGGYVRVESIDGVVTPGAITGGAETPGASSDGADTPGVVTSGANSVGAETPGASTVEMVTPGERTDGTVTHGASSVEAVTPGASNAGAVTPRASNTGAVTPGASNAGAATPGDARFQYVEMASAAGRNGLNLEMTSALGQPGYSRASFGKGYIELAKINRP